MAGNERNVDEAIELLRRVEGGVGQVAAGELTTAVGACGRLRSWIAAIEASCLGEVRRRKGDPGAVAATQGTSRRGAAAAVRRSKMVESLPVVGDALASGTITPDHVDALGLVRADHRGALATDVGALLEEAVNVDADQFRQGVRRWQQEQDRQTGESELERQRKNRKGSVSTRAEDGMGVFHFELDAITSARVSAALAQKSEQLWRDDNQGRRADASRPRRAGAQRMADAFAELTCSGDGDGESTVDTTIMVIADVDALRGGLEGHAELVDGTPLPVDEVRKMALSARLLPAIFDANGQPLWVGRSSRLPTAAQRAAIAARDRGCSIPGCDTPVGWCQIHHIVWWSRGGTTDLDNLATVCSQHHHMIHDDGWHVSRNGEGSVTWRSPP